MNARPLQQSRRSFGHRVGAAVLVFGAIGFVSELMCRGEELGAMLKGVSEYGLQGTAGRFVKGMIAYSLGFWIGTGMSALGGCGIAGPNRRDWHWLALVVGVLLMAVSALALGVVLGCYRGKM